MIIQSTLGLFIQSYPAVLGCDAAGLLEAVGSDVHDFKQGDAVFAHCRPGDAKSGAFQESIVLPSHEIGLKPSSWSFEEAASLPIATMTAAAAIYEGVGIPLPFLGLPSTATTNNLPRSILVLGGSSSVGSTTIQLLRLALPGCVIVATSSAKHHDHIQSLGASTVLDYHSPDLVKQIGQAVPEGTPVTAIVDCVNGLVLQPELLDVLVRNNSSDKKVIAEVMTGRNLTPEQIPEGIIHRPTNANSVQGSQPSFFARLGEYLNSREGKDRFRLPIPVEVLGNKWDCVGEGLMRLKEGKVSGSKLVVDVQ